ncbi:MAG: hypothetical protein HC941_03725 [Microcoleus sp. SU_5_3]|nr:hypothetical protein [Microcoleus sp. SU_5_3]
MSTVSFGLSTPVVAESGASYGSSQPPSITTRREQWIEVLVDSPFRGAGDSQGRKISYLPIGCRSN